MNDPRWDTLLGIAHSVHPKHTSVVFAAEREKDGIAIGCHECGWSTAVGNGQSIADLGHAWMLHLTAGIDALREERPMASGGIYAGPPIPLGDGCVIPKPGKRALTEEP